MTLEVTLHAIHLVCAIFWFGSYMWSEVMDADAFQAFKETGDPFDSGTAKKLLENIYSTGGSRDPAELYLAFRGKMPGVDALLEGRGLASG